MPRVLLFVLLAGLQLCVAAQTDDWTAFARRISAKEFAGRKFKLQAAVKVEPIDSTAAAHLWVRVDRTGTTHGFFNNMKEKPIRRKEWTVYTIEGRVDKDADYFVFGGIVRRKGLFYFDAFKLLIENAAGQFVETDLPGGSFDNTDYADAWNFTQGKNGFTFGSTDESFFDGMHSFKVDGSHFKKPAGFGTNDAAGKYAAVNGINIYYEMYGEGPPLLLLHGNSQSIEAFRLQIPGFSKHYKVIAVDTRGQGKSSEDGKAYSYDLFAADMNAFLDYLGLDSVSIVGWSDGGNTGLIMAMQYPGKVKKLVTMGANIFINHSAVKGIVLKELRRQIKEQKQEKNGSDQNRARLLQLMLTEPRHSFQELQAITCPVLVMAGEKDLIKTAHTKGIAANIKHSKLLIAEGETHDFPQENAQRFNAAVLQFLNDHLIEQAN